MKKSFDDMYQVAIKSLLFHNVSISTLYGSIYSGYLTECSWDGVILYIKFRDQIEETIDNDEIESIEILD